MAQWLDWAIELQSLAQAGLHYGHDVYDKERYQRIREIAAEIMAVHADIPVERVQDLFCNEKGYQTPKLDCRAAIFQDDKILLVQESSGQWALPGGWVEVNLSVKNNTIKEVKEETGLDAIPQRLIALHDRNLHNEPPYAYGICKVFSLCTVTGGEFHENSETLGYEYFAQDELPPLMADKTTVEQVQMCFEAYKDPQWQPVFD
ncbi:NUDIX hydrolase N-terminal domain-containing protein [Ligilactobacillus saerimneri]|uniref:NUDIX hydrolase N-terminal domain-containing protein n=1 Tax=Ligilactobacillus saerimneri TaxID=228229 RepID=UPI001C0F8942|nr:NUDIX hydrolase [Ligilactobacillus saerimneri]MBU5309666.1 NUDIX hydrolase [Ligilactobacillus saerimneri]MDI9206747.1 NUDIX hydrolase [Ligilactobacillus saerimneri]